MIKRLIERLDGVQAVLGIIIAIFVGGFSANTTINKMTSSPQMVDEQTASIVIAYSANKLKDHPAEVDIDLLVRSRDLCMALQEGANDSNYINNIYNYDSIRTNCAIINSYDVLAERRNNE